MSGTSCPIHRINKEVLEFRKNPHATKEQGVGMFERLFEWLSQCDKTDDTSDYMASSTTIFSIASELLKKNLITEAESVLMFERVFSVIGKDAGPDLMNFLKSRGFQLS